MRRKSLSKILSVVLSAAMLVPQGIYAAGNRSTELPTPDFKWDFEDVTDKQITGTGGIAVLNGTADVSEEAVTAAGVPCLPDGNHVLSLKGGSKGSSYVQLPSGLYEGVTADTGLTWSFWMNAENDVQETEGRETYDLLQGSVSKVDKPYKELSVPFTKGGSRMTVFFKIFNDGMAYRYEVDGDTASTAETTVVTGESSEFSLPDKGTIWTIDPSVTYEAYEYTKRTVAEQYDTEAKYSTPLLASLKEDSGN